jgi:hypothetical protein
MWRLFCRVQSLFGSVWLAHAMTKVAALENQLASSMYAASGGSSRAAASSPFAVPVLGDGGGLLRRSLDSGAKSKTTLRLEEDVGLRGGIVQRQLPLLPTFPSLAT